MKGKKGVFLGVTFRFRGSEMLAWNLELNVSLHFSISISDHLTALFSVCGMVLLTTFTPVCAKGLHNESVV